MRKHMTETSRKRKLSALQEQLEEAGAYGSIPPPGEAKSGLFVVSGILLGFAAGLLAVIVVALTAILSV